MPLLMTPRAISSIASVSLVPEASAGELLHPCAFTASTGFVFLRRINSDSNPTRNAALLDVAVL
jgi:hypothetical protein